MATSRRCKSARSNRGLAYPETLERRRLLAIEPVLVRDVNDAALAFDSPLTAFRDAVYFARTDEAGNELWTSDGTDAGTHLLVDLVPGSGSSYPRSLVEINDQLYFVANDELGRTSLWISDGTESGTTAIPQRINVYSDNYIAAIGDAVYFLAGGSELILTDGTAAGTRRAVVIRGDNGFETVNEVFALNDRLFLFTYNGIWASDGTQDGTSRIAAVSSPGGGVTSGGLIYFAANSSQWGRELWVSDGTSEGTRLVRDVVVGGGSANPSYLTDVDGTLYFTTAQASSQEQSQLWKTDGTASGTVLVKDVASSATHQLQARTQGGFGATPRHSPGGCYYYPYYYPCYEEVTNKIGSLTNAGGKLFFVADDDYSGAELWTSDGTQDGTVEVKDIGPGRFGSDPHSLTAFQEKLLFVADDPYDRAELWISDGTEDGTVQVKDIKPGRQSSDPHSLTAAGDRVFFTAMDDLGERTLWASDGSPEGTQAVTRFATPTQSSSPYGFVAGENAMWFTATDDDGRRSAWSTDGTAEGTLARFEDANAWEVVFFEGAAYFADDAGLWRSDSENEGAALIWEGGKPLRLTAWNGKIYFHDGARLWASDGSTSGTQLLAETSSIRSLTFAETRFYFDVEDASMREVWMSDGTVEGTTSMLALQHDADSFTNLWTLGIADDKALFAYREETYDYQSGTSQTRALVYAARPDSDSLDLLVEFTPPQNAYVDLPSFSAFGDRIVFAANQFRPSGRGQTEIFVSDGTVDGTINLGEASGLEFVGTAGQFSPVGERVNFVTADERTHWLWTTDGTSEGTELLLEIKRESNGFVEFWPMGVAGGNEYYVYREESYDNNTGINRARSSVYAVENETGHVTEVFAAGPLSNGYVFIEHIEFLDGRLIFAATVSDYNTGSYNVSWFGTDGTEEGTERLLRGQYPSQRAVVGGLLFFLSNSGALSVTDGTIDGTERLANNVAPISMAVVGDQLLLIAQDKLWISDGTQDGTQTALQFPASWKYVSQAFAAFGKLYLTADDGIHGEELWAITPPPGDTNFDGLVDLFDFNRMKKNFGREGENLAGDLNYDDVVDLEDFNLLKENFGYGVAEVESADPVNDFAAAVAINAALSDADEE